MAVQQLYRQEEQIKSRKKENGSICFGSLDGKPTSKNQEGKSIIKYIAFEVTNILL